jgi:hypothetical protein
MPNTARKKIMTAPPILSEDFAFGALVVAIGVAE